MLKAESSFETHDIAVLQGLDKPNARVQTLNVPVGKEAVFGPLRIKVRSCKKTPPEETPESAVFLEIIDTRTMQKAGAPPLFNGWMFASSPALSALEHPIYDVWILDCKKAETKPVSPPAASPAKKASPDKAKPKKP